MRYLLYLDNNKAVKMEKLPSGKELPSAFRSNSATFPNDAEYYLYVLARYDLYNARDRFRIFKRKPYQSDIEAFMDEMTILGYL